MLRKRRDATKDYIIEIVSKDKNQKRRQIFNTKKRLSMK